VITGYGTLKGLRRLEAEDCVDQFLTADEARQIADFLIANCSAKPEILPVELPIPKGSASPFYIRRFDGSGSGFRVVELFRDAASCTLPFKVKGLVDTDGCVPGNEEDDGQDMFRRLAGKR
jgi:hypothetical protein